MKIIHLANLYLTEEEQRTLPAQMDEIISFANRIKAIGTEKLSSEGEPLSFSVLREDCVGSTLSLDLVFLNAPTCIEGYITVPRVLDEE